MEVARRNAAAGFPQRDVNMLMGEGNYMTIQAQIQYDPGTIAQITSAALKAWRTIPGTGDLQGQLTKIG
ncbi:endogenous retrovirus group K member 5 Gag polyprotein-like isoform X1 [Leptotrombidium deliense]|uniref:Endogenous retrovirus group K member 5 Gag polyprotein-like isoform X1 n=1 Tax=Leptotrombidium deliense TaxID=299467 RepID=A0A443QH34_9ACAR|nr:endogenous retrovirus group K member 5 Gag polyprotein-like isoform X1 [Leptotrombidium deliense]